MRIEIQPNARQVYLDCLPGYYQTLTAPLDDMWATLADLAEPHALLLGGTLVGCCSVDTERKLRHFYLKPRFEDRGEAIFSHLLEHLEIPVAYPSTVDPSFLSLSLEAGRSATPAALLFHHCLEPEGTPLLDLQIAAAGDHRKAMAFVLEATGAPESFLQPYLSERIERGELLLHQEAGEIIASGECRVDQRWPGFAHLGLIVGANRRSRGLGKRLMHALVLESRRQHLTPLCSTSPENLAARRVIHHAGFRAHHRVFRVEVGV